MKLPKHCTVTVTEKDIRKGSPYDPGRCALALSLFRRLRRRCEVVGLGSARLAVAQFRDGQERTLTPEAYEFANAFDRGRTKPGRVRVW